VTVFGPTPRGKPLQGAMQKELSVAVEITQFPPMAGPGRSFRPASPPRTGLSSVMLSAGQKQEDRPQPSKGGGRAIPGGREEAAAGPGGQRILEWPAPVGIYILCPHDLLEKFRTAKEGVRGARIPPPKAPHPGAPGEPSVQTDAASRKNSFWDNLLEKRGYFTLKMNELAKAVRRRSPAQSGTKQNQQRRAT